MSSFEVNVELENEAGENVSIKFIAYGGTGLAGSPDETELDIEGVLVRSDVPLDEGWRSIEGDEIEALARSFGLKPVRREDDLVHALLASHKYGDAMSGAIDQGRDDQEAADAEAEEEWRYSR